MQPPKIKTVASPLAIDPAIMFMFLRQQQQRRRKGSFLTRGQRMDALARAKATTPQRSFAEAQAIKTRKKEVFKDFNPVEKGLKKDEWIKIEPKGKYSYRKAKNKFLPSDDYKPLEEKARFLAKQQGDVDILKSGREVAGNLYEEYQDENMSPAKANRVIKSKEKYKKYLQDYIDKTTKQLEKEYTTTQLRNLGIR